MGYIILQCWGVGREDLRLKQASTQPVLDEGNISAGRGSLATGTGHTFISNSESMCGPVPDTTTAIVEISHALYTMTYIQ